MATITNSNQLNHVIMSIMSDVIDSVTEELLKKLKDYIEEDVYSYNPKFYNRTHQFEESWKKDEISTVVGNMVQNKIYQEYGIMKFDAQLWRHGSEYSGALEENALAEIINEGGEKIGDIANFPRLDGRPFWNDFIKYANDNISKMFLKECANRNIILKGGNTRVFFKEK